MTGVLLVSRALVLEALYLPADTIIFGLDIRDGGDVLAFDVAQKDIPPATAQGGVEIEALFTNVEPTGDVRLRRAPKFVRWERR
jgi:hypothetical protein